MSSLVEEAAYTTALDEPTLALWVVGLIRPAVDDRLFLLCMEKCDGVDRRLCGFVGEYSYRDIGERVH